MPNFAIYWICVNELEKLKLPPQCARALEKVSERAQCMRDGKS
jgi:hypothetical protein